jgi:hypothetical protein
MERDGPLTTLQIRPRVSLRGVASQVGGWRDFGFLFGLLRRGDGLSWSLSQFSKARRIGSGSLPWKRTESVAGYKLTTDEPHFEFLLTRVCSPPEIAVQRSNTTWCCEANCEKRARLAQRTFGLPRTWPLSATDLPVHFWFEGLLCCDDGAARGEGARGLGFFR